jgi:uncharacterized protein (DUF1330 family)
LPAQKGATIRPPIRASWSPQRHGVNMAVDTLNIEGLTELEREDSGPVVMVNLMRFREQSGDGDGTGWDAYLRYSSLVVPMIKERGGVLLWAGNAKSIALGRTDREHWDYIALVYYPSIKSFLAMMRSPEYLEHCDPHRRNACAEHVIICTREAYSKFDIPAK